MEWNFRTIGDLEKDVRNLREWYAAVNLFAIMFAERFTA
tara:strand:- start:22267 stop:22383 length:117 start_codon:yes stop_codon:yes gene_type:complete